VTERGFFVRESRLCGVEIEREGEGGRKELFSLSLSFTPHKRARGARHDES
jgi:hypothetical protein